MGQVQESRGKRNGPDNASALNASMVVLIVLAAWCSLSARFACPCSWPVLGENSCTSLEIGKSTACPGAFLVGPVIVSLNLWKNRSRWMILLLATYLGLLGYVYTTASARCGSADRHSVVLSS